MLNKMCKYAAKVLVVLGLLVMAASLPVVQGCGKAEKKPNVILISIDTLRADHLGCYGYERDTSPNIDAFAKDGVLFKGAISASNWTAPSHMSIFSSLYPPVHGVNQYPYPAKLKDDIKILPEYFKEAGYYTLGAYDSWYVGEELGFGKGYDSYSRIGPVKNAVEEVLASLDKREEDGRPFFMFLHAFDVHEPYMDPERKDPGYDRLYDKDYDGFVVTGSDEENKKILNMAMQGKDVSRDIQHSVALYDGAINYTDYYIGELLKGLRERGLYDNSLIVFLSDHGQEFLDHGRVSHTQLYREIINVPLIIKPSRGLSKDGIIKPGRTYEHVVSLVDIMPTLLDLIGIPFNEFHQGVSLRQALAEGKEMGLTVYSSNRFFEDGWPYQRSVMDDRYHFMRSQKNKGHPMFRKGYVEELYSTASDPSERNDLSKENPGAAEYYLNKVFSWEKEMLADRIKATSDTSEASPVDVSEEQKEQLKALGYVQ